MSHDRKSAHRFTSVTTGFRRLSAALLACITTAATLTACGRTVPTSATVAPETLTPISRAYSVESNELVEISHFEDGSTKYMPTGWIVVSASTTGTATASTSGQ